MIKVQNDIENDLENPVAQAYLDPFVFELLKKSGIDIGQHDKPDLVLALANDLEEVKPKTIGIEKIDGCQIRNRKLLSNPNLIKLVKMYSYPYLWINNLPCVDARLFTRFLGTEKSDWVKPKIELDNSQFAKVTTGLSFLHYRRHDRVEKMAENIDFYHKRDIDVFFAGTTEYGNGDHKSGNLITRHRQSLVEKLRELGENQPSLNIMVGGRKAFGYDDYLDIMSRSKVVISPWGWGEACYRDYEALICGAQLIKPSAFDFYSSEEIYNSPSVFWCSAQWYRLDDIIANVLNPPPHRGWYQSNKLCLKRRPEFKAKIIRGIIKECIE